MICVSIWVVINTEVIIAWQNRFKCMCSIVSAIESIELTAIIKVYSKPKSMYMTFTTANRLL